jgi:hypothetical protein
MSDLSILFPTHHLDIGGRTVSISPFKFGQLPKAMSKAKTVFGHLAELVSKKEGNQSLDISLVMSAMEIGGDDLIDLITMCSNVDREFIELLSMDEGIKLTGAFLEVNLSFFVQKVLPEFQAAMARVTEATGVKS